MLDIRLDFISNINKEYIDRMSSIRRLFIEIDKELGMFSDQTKDPATLRAIALSRTNNETACQYAIKSLCLLGEIK